MQSIMGKRLNTHLEAKQGGSLGCAGDADGESHSLAVQVVQLRLLKCWDIILVPRSCCRIVHDLQLQAINLPCLPLAKLG